MQITIAINFPDALSENLSTKETRGNVASVRTVKDCSELSLCNRLLKLTEILVVVSH